jgi:gluconolactonase
MRTAALLLLASCCSGQELTFGPDSERHAGVPRGRVEQFEWESTIFPGTTRNVWIYVPAQYKPESSAAVTIFQDGGGYVAEDGHSHTPIVLDNLIHQGAIPVMIGVFINPGVVPPDNPRQQARLNRSYEYDALGDRYARFLIGEILPEVAKKYNITTDANLRALVGTSSGGIAALNAAFERPDAFRRVVSFVGSFTNLRGGPLLASMIRKSEPRPLRVWLFDGELDRDHYPGSWWYANHEMDHALTYAGYEHQFVKGKGPHGMSEGGKLVPQALRYVWADWRMAIPKPHNEQQEVWTLAAGEWEQVGEGYRFTEGPAVNAKGEVFFTDIPNNKVWRVTGDAAPVLFREDTGGANGLMFGADGKLYACQNSRKRIVRWSMDGAEEVLAEDVPSNDIAIAANGAVYFSDPPNRRVWLIDPQGQRRVVHEGIAFPNGVLLSPDQRQLWVADYRSRWVWSFTVEKDMSLSNGEAFNRLEYPDEADSALPDGMTTDSEGWLYVAARNGVQVADPLGKIHAILAKPQPGALSNLVFGGENLEWLYATAGDKVFRRKMKRHGVLPWQIVTPPRPRT